MSMGNETNDPRNDAKAAQASACVCCFAGALILIVGWLASCGLARLFGGDPRAAAWPDPVCERCGLVLDGAHPVCAGDESDCCDAAGLMARVKGGP